MKKMRRIFKPCSFCNGTGIVPVLAEEDSTGMRMGDKLYDKTCEYCQGSGCSDEVLAFIEEDEITTFSDDQIRNALRLE